MCRALQKRNATIVRTVFTDSLLHSRMMWMQHFQFLEPDLLVAVLKNHQLSTEVELVGQTLQKIHAKVYAGRLDVATLRQMLNDPTALDLKQYLTLSGPQLKRQRYRVESEADRNLRVIEEAFKMLKDEEKNLYQEQEEEESSSSSTDDEEEVPVEEEKVQWWVPKNGFYSIWVTVVFARVVVAALWYNEEKDKVFEEKRRIFIDKHVPLMKYLDEHTSIDNEEEFLSLYPQGAPSPFVNDFENPVSYERKHRPRPLEVIRKHYPALLWTPEEWVLQNKVRVQRIDEEGWCPFPQEPPLHTHRFYYGVVAVLNQCKQCMDEHCETPNPLFDALWTYYCSWVDLFEYCLTQPSGRMDDDFLLNPPNTYRTRTGDIERSQDMLSPWEMYGTLDTRTFTACDLPDLFHCLMDIPLSGQKRRTCTYRIGHLLQKALPFASQRRGIILHLIALLKNPKEQDDIWPIFRQLAWCLLAGLYPGEFAALDIRTSMRELLRIRELTSSKERMLRALTINQSAFSKEGDTTGSNGGSIVATTFFSLYVVYMASFNPWYEAEARRCIAWDMFKLRTIEYANEMRTHDLFPDDPFGQARRRMAKTVKNYMSKVHRWHKHPMARTIAEVLDHWVEKKLFKMKFMLEEDRPKLVNMIARVGRVPFEELFKSWRETSVLGYEVPESLFRTEINSLGELAAVLQSCVDLCDKAAAFFKNLFHVTFRPEMVNKMLFMQPSLRMTRQAFNDLTGMTPQGIDLLCEMVQVYHTDSKPRKFAALVGQMTATDLVRACFYVNTAWKFSNVFLSPLDAETTRLVNQANMRKRHHYYPGEPIPPQIYMVGLTLCCNRITNMLGCGKHGHVKVSYDFDRNVCVCARGKPRDDDDDDEKEEEDEDSETESEDEDKELRAQEADIADAITDGFCLEALVDLTGREQKKQIVQERGFIRQQRNAFKKIPCGEPVLFFSLYGAVLHKNGSCYFHAPCCGALQRYHISGFWGSPDGQYRCEDCARAEPFHLKWDFCVACSKQCYKPKAEHYFPAMDYQERDIDRVMRLVYFCPRHATAAKYYYSRGLPLATIKEKIAAYEHNQRVKYSNMQGTKK
jgi:hypothetical protein